MSTSLKLSLTKALRFQLCTVQMCSYNLPTHQILKKQPVSQRNNKIFLVAILINICLISIVVKIFLSHAEVSNSPLSKPVFLHFRPVNLN